ncbi:MAG: VOC family protein [Pseudomonadota bacterium]
MTALRIDHVHLSVRDREASAAWYADVLGLTCDPSFAVWAEHPAGPLILSTADGHPALSLFQRGDALPDDNTVAFRFDGEAFLTFMRRLGGLALHDRTGTLLTTASVIDHDLALSLYFVDPDGNRLEVTTYDVAAVKRRRPS